MKPALIVAASINNVIGRNGTLPWKQRADLQRFKQLTMGHHVIMGRKTYESLPKMLPGRTNVVLTSRSGYPNAVRSIEEALELCSADPQPFIIGGAQVYEQGLAFCKTIYLTRIMANVDGDAFLPHINWDEWKLINWMANPEDAHNQYPTRFKVYSRIQT